jgi:aminopeptidase N
MLFAALFVSAFGSEPFRTLDTYPRQQGVDALHYVFRLTLSDSTDEIQGEATAEIRFTKDNVAELVLDLMSVVDSSKKGMTVTEVSSGGTVIKATHQADRLHIPVTGVKAGDRRLFTVKYHGVPGPGLRIGKNQYGDRTFFSLNWPDKARQWIPIIDHPGDKATSEFYVTAPVKYRVVSNGLLQEERELGDGRRMTHWKQSVPIASWLNTIGVAQFATHHAGVVKGIELQTWAFPQDSLNGPITFEGPARQAIEFYSDHIGPYTYEKLANIQTAGLGGGTEHASAIAYGEKSVKNQPATGLVAHEIAHQWFGDGVTERDWDDVWLSEGFATYFTLLFTEHYSGRDAFVAGLKRSRETVFRTEARMPGKAVIHDNLSNMREVLNQLVYQKGGWTGRSIC